MKIASCMPLYQLRLERSPFFSSSASIALRAVSKNKFTKVRTETHCMKSVCIRMFTSVIA